MGALKAKGAQSECGLALEVNFQSRVMSIALQISFKWAPNYFK